MKYRTSVAIVFATIATAAAAVSAQVVDNLSWLTGGSYTDATRISDDGNTCSAWGDTSNFGGIDSAVRWTNFSVFPLGLLPGGAFNSYAEDVSPNGIYLTGFGGTPSGSRAFLHSQSGGYVVIPPGGASYAVGSGLTDFPGVLIVGTGYGGAYPAAGQAFISVGGGTPYYMGNVSGQPWSSAKAISADGSTVVGASGAVAFRWLQQTQTMTSLGSLPGQLSAEATDVNSEGSVICGIWRTSSNDRGFRWTAATGMVDLGLFPNGGTALRPRAINGDGSVIVGQAHDNSGLFAFIWTPATGLQRLSDHLAARGIDNTNRTYVDCKGVNASASAFCGSGTYFGSPFGFVVRGLPTCATFSGLTGSTLTCPGGTVSITILATGTGLVYQHYRNNVLITDGPTPNGSIVSGATTPTVTYSSFNPADSGSYHGVVSTAGVCAFTSGTISFGAFPPPTINTHPVATSGCIGATVMLSATATSESSTTFRWQRRVPPFPNVYADIFDGPTGNGSTYSGTGLTNFTGTGTSVLVINNAQPADSERYRCVVYHPCGPANTAVTSNALVRVFANTTIIDQPQDTQICLGDNDAYFSVTASPINDTFTYQWQKRNPIFFNVYNDIFDGPTGNGGNYGGTQTANLTVAGVYAADLGYYRCVVTGTCQSVVSNDAYLSEADTPFVLSGPDNAAACQGTDAAMTVNAVPLGSTYQWQKYIGPCILCWQDLFDGPTGNGGTFSGTQSPTLTINTIDLADTFTTYRCLITGPCGGNPTASPEAAFSLLDPPLIQTQPVGGPVCPSGTKQLTVALAPGNYGAVTYQWWRFVPDFPIFAQIPSGALPSGAIAAGTQTATLTLSNFKQQDAGQYYCTVTGDCAPVPSSVVTLTFCIADFDCSGTVAVPDIFAFLSAWFAQSPSADIDGNPGVTVPDIFAFLSLWFAGCP